MSPFDIFLNKRIFINKKRFFESNISKGRSKEIGIANDWFDFLETGPILTRITHVDSITFLNFSRRKFSDSFDGYFVYDDTINCFSKYPSNSIIEDYEV